jgi:hypothetical protein
VKVLAEQWRTPNPFVLQQAGAHFKGRTLSVTAGIATEPEELASPQSSALGGKMLAQ